MLRFVLCASFSLLLASLEVSDSGEKAESAEGMESVQAACAGIVFLLLMMRLRAST